MSTPIVRAGVAEYVAAVRAQLDDLSPEEIDELTGGLEADLDDALDDALAVGSEPQEQFGPPAAYAAELRAAAGLPPRAVPGGRRGAGDRIRGRWRAVATRVTSHRHWPAVRDFLLTIRPAWWVARGMLLSLVFMGLGGFVAFCLMIVVVVVSVELGRRKAAERGLRWRVPIVLANVVAAVLVPAVLSGVAGSPTSEPVQVVSPQNGLWVDGVEVRNVFPYDEQGRPLQGVQLYDENGRPVQVGDSARTPVDMGTGPVGQAPAVDDAGRQHWNVFPLRQVPGDYDDNGDLRLGPGGPVAASPPPVTPGPILVGGAAAPSSAAPSSAAPSSAAPSSAAPTSGPVGNTVVTATAAPSASITTPVAPAAPAPATPAPATPAPAATARTVTPTSP